MKLEVLVERPNGSTYVQEIEYIGNVRTSIRVAQHMFGKAYRICKWWVVNNDCNYREAI